MGILLAICAIIGFVSLLGGAINTLGKVSVGLLKYVIGPVAVLLIIMLCCCMK